MVNPTDAAKAFYTYYGKWIRATLNAPTPDFERLPEREREVLEASARMATALLLADLSQSLIGGHLPEIPTNERKPE